MFSSKPTREINGKHSRAFSVRPCTNTPDGPVLDSKAFLPDQQCHDFNTKSQNNRKTPGNSQKHLQPELKLYKTPRKSRPAHLEAVQSVLRAQLKKIKALLNHCDSQKLLGMCTTRFAVVLGNYWLVDFEICGFFKSLNDSGSKGFRSSESHG